MVSEYVDRVNHRKPIDCCSFSQQTANRLQIGRAAPSTRCSSPCFSPTYPHFSSALIDVFQIITDRFALASSYEDPPAPSCALEETYCGGSFQGIIEHLDYITGMGFDAIWISPVVKNVPQSYHGYGAEDIYSINPHFGTADDLVDLVQGLN